MATRGWPSHKGLTVVNRFTASTGNNGGDTDSVERELARTCDFLRRQPDFDFLVRVRLIRHDNVYVQLGYWRSHAGFVNAVSQQPFSDQVERLTPLVLETQADQATSVARVIAARTCVIPGDAFGVLTEYILDGSARRFEEHAHDQARSYLDYGGFGGSDLLRSVLRPQRYLGISWWYDADDFAAASHADDNHRSLHATAVRVEQTGRIAYEKAIVPA